MTVIQNGMLIQSWELPGKEEKVTCVPLRQRVWRDRRQNDPKRAIGKSRLQQHERMNGMKKIVMLLLTACLLVSLSACGKNAESDKNTEESQGTEEFQEPLDEETIDGVINRLGDYLVLLGSDENYHIFDFGEGVDRKSLAEGDSVKVTYVGVLDQEDPAPVAVAIEKTDG